MFFKKQISSGSFICAKKSLLFLVAVISCISYNVYSVKMISNKPAIDNYLKDKQYIKKHIKSGETICAITIQGNMLLIHSSSFDSIILFDTAKRKKICTIRYSSGKCQFLKKGAYFWTIKNGNLMVFCTKSAKLLWSKKLVDDKKESVRFCMFNKDETFFVLSFAKRAESIACMESEGGVRVYSVQDITDSASFGQVAEKKGGIVHYCNFAKKNAYMIILSSQQAGRELQIYGTKSFKPQLKKPKKDVCKCILSSDGACVALVLFDLHKDACVQLFDIPRLQPKLSQPIYGNYDDIRISPDNNYLFVKQHTASHLKVISVLTAKEVLHVDTLFTRMGYDFSKNGKCLAAHTLCEINGGDSYATRLSVYKIPMSCAFYSKILEQKEDFCDLRNIVDISFVKNKDNKIQVSYNTKDSNSPNCIDTETICLYQNFKENIFKKIQKKAYADLVIRINS